MDKQKIALVIDIKTEIRSSDLSKNLISCYNQSFLWNSNMTKEETRKKLDTMLQVIKETTLSCLY